MKLMLLVALTAGCGLYATHSYAQSCSSPTPLASGQTITNAGGLPTTCGGDQSFTDICGGATLTGASRVYSLGVGPSPSGSITVTPTAPTTYNTAIAIVGPGASCAASLGTCDATSDSSNTSGAETVSLAGLAAGTYYLVISWFDTTAANQCGPYGLTVGTLPVKLQKFSVN